MRLLTKRFKSKVLAVQLYFSPQVPQNDSIFFKAELMSRATAFYEVTSLTTTYQIKPLMITGILCRHTHIFIAATRQLTRSICFIDLSTHEHHCIIFSILFAISIWTYFFTNTLYIPQLYLDLSEHRFKIYSFNAVVW